MEFGELKDDEEIQTKILNVDNSVKQIEKLLDTALNNEAYDSLGTEDKVNYDLFTAYTLDTLYWIYLRTKGIDPNNNEVKNELDRINEYMHKAKQAQDRKLRPKLNQGAAKRFIKHGTSNVEHGKNSGKKRKTEND